MAASGVCYQIPHLRAYKYYLFPTVPQGYLPFTFTRHSLLCLHKAISQGYFPPPSQNNLPPPSQNHLHRATSLHLQKATFLHPHIATSLHPHKATSLHPHKATSLHLHKATSLHPHKATFLYPHKATSLHLHTCGLPPPSQCCHLFHLLTCGYSKKVGCIFQ